MFALTTNGSTDTASSRSRSRASQRAPRHRASGRRATAGSRWRRDDRRQTRGLLSALMCVQIGEPRQTRLTTGVVGSLLWVGGAWHWHCCSGTGGPREMSAHTRPGQKSTEQARQQGRRTQRLVGLVQTNRCTHTGDFLARRTLGATGWFPSLGALLRQGIGDDSERSWTSVPAGCCPYLPGYPLVTQ